jgi:hypothetical protein
MGFVLLLQLQHRCSGLYHVSNVSQPDVDAAFGNNYSLLYSNNRNRVR